MRVSPPLMATTDHPPPRLIGVASEALWLPFGACICTCISELSSFNFGKWDTQHATSVRDAYVLHATIQRIAPFLRHVHPACLIQAAQRILDVC